MEIPPYDFGAIEERWRERWEREPPIRADAGSDADPFYCLVMYPYPSGDLHVGHGKNYFLGDVVARYKTMRGCRVLHPMGWDAFGLPAENAAIREGVDPERFTYDNIDKMRRQLRTWSLAYDWDREIATCHPGFYRWNQWLFLKLFERGLAYRRAAPVNWCPSCNTVLANEQVVDGRCERDGTEVEQRELEQWFVRITEYAEKLLAGIERLHSWPETVKEQQRHWIGRSEGAEIRFPVEGEEEPIEVFTTRPDTLWGATFLVLAPEYPRLGELLRSGGRRAEVEEYVRAALAKSRMERGGEEAGRTGIDTGRRARNPATGESIPIWVADYVLADYGSGAIMAVPAHDQRDFEFARTFGLPVVVVIDDPEAPLDPKEMTEAVPDRGVCVLSGPLDGLRPGPAKEAAIRWLEEEGLGRGAVGYRLRDWLVSRQRYWGTPIPIVHCPECGPVPVPEDELPVLLPKGVDFRPTGRSPLASVKDFVETTCPACGGAAERETDTLDTFVDSSWYFFRYLAPRDDERIFDPKAVEPWFPIHQYIGGVEHACGHLLYCRFFTKFLHDLGLSPVDEPVERLFTQGMICKLAYRCETHKWLHESEVEGVDSETPRCRHCGASVVTNLYKMSKTKKNVTNPAEHLSEVGVDASRLYTLFIGPPELDAEWNDRAVQGPFKFLGRLWESAHKGLAAVEAHRREGPGGDPDLRRKTHQVIAGVAHDVEAFHFHTAIAKLMELGNAIRGSEEDAAAGEALWVMHLLIAPFAQHLAEELHVLFGGEGSVFHASWPEADAEVAREDEVEVTVQIDGRTRGRVRVPAEAAPEVLKQRAREDAKIAERLADADIVNEIVVPGRLVNFVTRGR